MPESEDRESYSARCEAWPEHREQVIAVAQNEQEERRCEQRSEVNRSQISVAQLVVAALGNEHRINWSNRSGEGRCDHIERDHDLHAGTIDADSNSISENAQLKEIGPEKTE